MKIDFRGDEEEADFYERKTAERARIGEAYNGATKDWSIVDVPPGTERVRMDGVGGGSQEISWQKYNGVRRSKFIPERAPERVAERERVEIRDEPRRESSGLEIEISTRRREGSGSYERDYERIEETRGSQVGFPRGAPKQRAGDLWTEITKDLVVREAIEELGYDYEETEYFYYIIQYLKYVSHFCPSFFPPPPLSTSFASRPFYNPKSRGRKETNNHKGRRPRIGPAQRDDSSGETRSPA